MNMRKGIVLVIAVVFTSSVKAQIDKGFWMFGGSASFESTEYPGGDKETIFTLLPKAGYFVIDNLAAGINLDFRRIKRDVAGPTGGYKITEFTAGPFVRYYLLKSGQPFNVFAEGSVTFGTYNQKNFDRTSNITQYLFNAGPVIFFNESVGLEMSIGYRSRAYKEKSSTSKYNSVLVGIGFMVHLSKRE